jgi:hypothetical protein
MVALVSVGSADGGEAPKRQHVRTHPAHRIDELLPWNWKALRNEVPTAAAA